MDYNQPYGASTGAAYVNGNPATGVTGSIPPAAAIEDPQREIVGLITDAGLTPDNANLHQLALAVQNGKLNYAADTGSANVVVIALPRPPAAYTAGMVFHVKIAAPNTGAATLNVNGLGAKAIVHINDGSALIKGDLTAGMMATMIFDGTNIQLVGSLSIAFVGNRTFYVNAGTGSDTTGDGSAGAPWQTLTFARNYVKLHYNLNGYVVTFSCTGTFTEGLTAVGAIPGSGDPSTELWTFTGASGITATLSCGIVASYGARLTVSAAGGASLTISASGTAAGQGFGIGCSTGAVIWLGANIVFGTCQSVVIGGDPTQTSNGGYVRIMSSYSASGNANVHWLANSCEIVALSGITVSLGGTPSYTSFATTYGLGLISCGGVIFSGPAVGQRYSSYQIAVINTAGGGANFFPGNVAGVADAATGGVYI